MEMYWLQKVQIIILYLSNIHLILHFNGPNMIIIRSSACHMFKHKNHQNSSLLTKFTDPAIIQNTLDHFEWLGYEFFETKMRLKECKHVAN